MTGLQASGIVTGRLVFGDERHIAAVRVLEKVEDLARSEIECRECDGFGVVDYKENDCLKCNGTGSVRLSREKLMTMDEAALDELEVCEDEEL